ncbi:MmgE/PrpD family protein [Saccharopolyspora sp. K220]|uniref:MmgE/PrpD family protein n=1 Tax=Saccharopolyspora soli TaxID=2926618 RepID=UPI001F5904FD|nr:MmgE/PrpD family protein [Saccharopolyspora soli]MCI2417879.1 MmgE/PrpD family protein [Saccharopolyspora soli]
MTANKGVGPTEAIADFVQQVDFSTAPAEVWPRAAAAFVDTVGVAIAGHADGGFQTLLATMRPELPTGPATILPTGERTSAAMAALLNGGAGHALDFDDVADQIYGHPSVVLVPTILAVAEEVGATGRDALAAYALGFDVCCAIAATMEVRAHYQRGWHSTATIGVLGATAAAARLLGLDTTRTRHALGIAASTASGSRQNFGTMTKPLHPGLAARDAVLAANLARNGFTADPAQLEGPLGYLAMYADSADPSAVARALGNPWELARIGLNVKKYPCCYNTHRTADAILDLVRDNPMRPEDIAEIRLTLEPGGFDPLIHRRPRTGLEGKFSPEYVLAAAVLDGKIALASFQDEAVLRPAAQQLLRRVTRHESAVPPIGPEDWEFAYSVVEVETTDGEILRHRTDVPRGDRREPLGRSDLEAKFRDCVAFAGTGQDAEKLLDELWQLETADHTGPLLNL